MLYLFNDVDESVLNIKYLIFARKLSDSYSTVYSIQLMIKNELVELFYNEKEHRDSYFQKLIQFLLKE